MSQAVNNHQWEWENCVVCGGAVEPGHTAARVNHHGDTVNLCSADCLRRFADEPAPYIARMAKSLREQELAAGRLTL